MIGHVYPANNWYCIQGDQRVKTFTQEDYDQICRDTYKRSDAFAIQNDNGEIPAWRWLCYAYQ
jgi:hypothetical protein